jgi:hypothetical protein
MLLAKQVCCNVGMQQQPTQQLQHSYFEYPTDGVLILNGPVQGALPALRASSDVCYVVVSATPQQNNFRIDVDANACCVCGGVIAPGSEYVDCMLGCGCGNSAHQQCRNNAGWQVLAGIERCHMCTPPAQQQMAEQVQEQEQQVDVADTTSLQGLGGEPALPPGELEMIQALAEQHNREDAAAAVAGEVGTTTADTTDATDAEQAAAADHADEVPTTTGQPQHVGDGGPAAGQQPPAGSLQLEVSQQLAPHHHRPGGQKVRLPGGPTLLFSNSRDIADLMQMHMRRQLQSEPQEPPPILL